MSTYFAGKVVVVTGGSDGIGRALVEKLILLKAKVATCGRDSDKLYNLQLRNPDAPLLTMTCDVSNENDCRRFIELCLKSYGSIDVLINNAGISMRALFKEADMKVMRDLMEINFFGAVYCTKQALPSLIDRKGTIVGISSIAGYRGLPGRSGYSASKFALLGWLEALRAELIDDDVNVMWICPGFTSSNIRNAALNEKGERQGESTMDEGKMMTADECANHILTAIEKRKRSLVLTLTGKKTVFMNKFFPAWTDKLINRFFIREGKLK